MTTLLSPQVLGVALASFLAGAAVAHRLLSNPPAGGASTATSSAEKGPATPATLAAPEAPAAAPLTAAAAAAADVTEIRLPSASEIETAEEA
jgi:hypothetical protein